MTDPQLFSAPCDTTEAAEFVPFIKELASASGELIRRYYMSDAGIETKPDSTPVTEADRNAEALMREMIERRYADHGVIGEEYGETRPDARYRWTLDPIDGTKSFISHCYLFGTLIALLSRARHLAHRHGRAAA